MVRTGIGFLCTCGKHAGGAQLAGGSWPPGAPCTCFGAVVHLPLVVTAGTAGWPVGRGRSPAVCVPCLTDLPSQDMENKIRSTLNEIYFGKTKDIVNGLR